jgi:hypothetical protein
MFTIFLTEDCNLITEARKATHCHLEGKNFKFYGNSVRLLLPVKQEISQKKYNRQKKSNPDRGHPVVLIMTIILYIKQSYNTIFSMYLITIDI